MKTTERVREALLGVPTSDYFRQRAFAGWKPVAIIWEREIEEETGAPVLASEAVPYGLQISPDASTLEENPGEKAVLLAVFDGIVQDKRLSQVAKELNENGYRTRHGDPWTPTDVFDLLPRLIEIGPRVFPTREWAERRQQLFRAVS
ncbi:MAG: recombinase family protein [Bryobacterales bacterium]|nr:recombinase family protein [Bryobacterales bacterium]